MVDIRAHGLSFNAEQRHGGQQSVDQRENVVDEQCLHAESHPDTAEEGISMQQAVARVDVLLCGFWVRVDQAAEGQVGSCGVTCRQREARGSAGV